MSGLDFNLNALIKLINKNNDDTIQKTELDQFMKTQNRTKGSVFTNYFSSISSDITVDDFSKGIDTHVENHIKNLAPSERSSLDTKLYFTDETSKKEYETIKNKDETKAMLESQFSHFFRSDEKFNSVFESFYTENPDIEYIATNLETYKSTHPIPATETLRRLNESNQDYLGIDLQNLVFEDTDLTPYSKAIKALPFNENTFAKVSQKNLPEGFVPREILEKGKTIGLGIDKAHQNGYTGQGVGYAIIDSGVTPHKNLNFTSYNTAPSADSNTINHFHGSSVSSIAQEIVPSADCHYFAQNNCRDSGKMTVENLNSIYEKNKKLKAEGKPIIRFVSMSMPLRGGTEAQDAVKKLEEQGVWVYYSGCPEDEQKGYLTKINPNGDPNDFENYQIVLEAPPGGIYVNSGHRTVADNDFSSTGYRHDSGASQSWAIPVIAGYYVLACQADPTMTKERFMQLAKETAYVTKSTLPNWERTGGHIGEGSHSLTGTRSQNTIEIRIIDINALLKRIEEEKTP